MRTEVDVIGKCESCGRGTKIELKGVPIKVLGVSTPSNVECGVCAECGIVVSLPYLSETFVMRVLRQRGVVHELVGGVAQIIEETNRSLKKRK